MRIKHILVVDDDPSICRMVGDMFRDEGYVVTSAHSGRTALTQLEGARTNLVILDLHIPDGDGRQVLGIMRSQPHLASIPVLVITTGQSRVRLNGDIVALLDKPFDLDHLLQLVVDAIGPAADENLTV